MSEESVENAVTESNRRGRPRPGITIERDAQTMALLEGGPVTKTELAAKLGVKDTEAYLSLHRLKTQGIARRVRSGSTHTWELVPVEDRGQIIEVATAESIESVPEHPVVETSAEEAEQTPVYGI